MRPQADVKSKLAELKKQKKKIKPTEAEATLEALKHSDKVMKCGGCTQENHIK